jgi:hypothetical protein
MNMIPNTETICAAMAALRKQEAVMNKGWDRRDAAYGLPVLEVSCFSGDGECGFIGVLWDHSPWSIQEAVEAAKRVGGKVYLVQEWVSPTPSEPKKGIYGPWARPIDMGFQMEVWPEFTGKDRYENEQE